MNHNIQVHFMSGKFKKLVIDPTLFPTESIDINGVYHDYPFVLSLLTFVESPIKITGEFRAVMILIDDDTLPSVRKYFPDTKALAATGDWKIKRDHLKEVE